MQSKCPRCETQIPLKRFLSPVIVVGYNNIDDNVHICNKCSAYIEWTINRKIAVILAYAFFALYLFIGSNVASSFWLFKVLLPSLIIPALILLFFPNQVKVREEKTIHIANTKAMPIKKGHYKDLFFDDIKNCVSL